MKARVEIYIQKMKNVRKGGTNHEKYDHKAGGAGIAAKI